MCESNRTFILWTVKLLRLPTQHLKAEKKNKKNPKLDIIYTPCKGKKSCHNIPTWLFRKALGGCMFYLSFLGGRSCSAGKPSIFRPGAKNAPGSRKRSSWWFQKASPGPIIGDIQTWRKHHGEQMRSKNTELGLKQKKEEDCFTRSFQLSNLILWSVWYSIWSSRFYL